MGPTRGFSTCFSAVRGEEPGGELRAPRSPRLGAGLSHLLWEFSNMDSQT